jgi:hypothetical protein
MESIFDLDLDLFRSLWPSECTIHSLLMMMIVALLPYKSQATELGYRANLHSLLQVSIESDSAYSL